MAYQLMVHDYIGTDSVDTSSVPTSLFASVSSGYTGNNCSVAYDSSLVKWTGTGNAATTEMEWRYNSGVSYASGKVVYFHARVTITTPGATMTAIKLMLRGSTLGSTTLQTISNPLVGKTYDMYGSYTFPGSGWTGTIYLCVNVTDDVTTNGIAFTVTHWVGVDQTTEQSAGTESAAADLYAYDVWRQAPLDSQEWAGDDAYFRWLRLTAHGLTSGDMLGYWTGAIWQYYCVHVIDANWVAVCPSAPAAAATVYVWKQTDRTSHVDAASIQINLRADADTEMSFSARSLADDSDWHPIPGMVVSAWNSGTLVHAGVITTCAKVKLPGSSPATYRTQCTVTSFSTYAYRMIASNLDGSIWTSSWTTKQAVAQIISLLLPWGIQYGRVETGVAAIGSQDKAVKTVAEWASSLAKQAGKYWWIDKERRIHFRGTSVVPASAAHHLVDGNGYANFRDMQWAESSDELATLLYVVGAAATTGTPIAASGTLSDISGTPPTMGWEPGSPEYWRYMVDSSFNNATDAANAAKEYLKQYGLQIPAALSFDSDDVDWLPNTKLRVMLKDLGISGGTTTVTQLLTEGDFGATTGWTAGAATHAVSGGILSNTGSGAAATGTESQTIKAAASTGRKHYVKGRVRVTNSSCQTLSVYLNATGWAASVSIFSQASPAINTWYPFSAVITEPEGSRSAAVLYAAHAYADAATQNGKVMQLQYFDAICLLDAFGADGEPTQAQMDTAMAAYDPTNGYVDTTAALALATPRYMNVDSVSIYDATGTGVMRAKVTARQRDGTQFASAPNAGGGSYLGALQWKADAAVTAFGAERIRYGTVTLNSTTDTDITFSTPFADANYYIILSPVTSTSGVIAPKTRTLTASGCKAVIGGTGFSNIVCHYLAIANR